MTKKAALISAVHKEVTNYRSAKREAQTGRAWIALERAHILSQSMMIWHMRVHLTMFSFAISQKDFREACGQAVRMALVPLGSLTGRIPIGNTGRANVSAFQSMPLPPDLRKLLSD